MVKLSLTIVALAGGVALLCSPIFSQGSFAQDHQQMHDGGQAAKPIKSKPKAKAKKPNDMRSPHGGMDHGNSLHGQSSSTEHDGAHGGGHDMKGFLGPYGMGREGSGTSWQPDTSPHGGIHAQYGDWLRCGMG